MKTLVLEKMPDIFWQIIKKKNWQEYFATSCSSDEVDTIVIRTHTIVDADFILEYPNLKLIIRAGTGIDNIDLNAAKRNNITVLNTPEANAHSAYEHTLSLILALIKQHQKWKENILNNKWKNGIDFNWEISELRVLVIGVGRVGTKVANTLSMLGADVLGYDPYLTANDWQTKSVESCELSAGLEWCNLLTFHCPLNQETENYFDDDLVNQLQNPAWIINTARGKLINENTLIKVLQNRLILGYGTDVFAKEPWKAKDYANLDNVMITPHVGSFTLKAKNRMAEETLQVWKRYQI